jgi:polyisoprenyl-phosphate glycosyltransferase
MKSANDAKTDRKLITISIPVLNEEGNIDRLIERLRAVAAGNSQYDFEFLFTDNASTDDTFVKLAEEAASEPRLRVLRFSRNFGFQRSILTNLLNARGAAAIQIDADMQDPPELITVFLKKWEEGYKVVYGVRRSRKENVVLSQARRLYYRMIRHLSEADIPVDAGDFRLVDRVIIEHLRTINDRYPYLRGIVASLGYPQIGVVYDRAARVSGSSKFNFWKLMSLSFDGICSLTIKPLQYVTYLGFVLSFITIALIIYYSFDYLFGTSSEARGFTTLVLLVLVSISVNVAFIGLLGEYVGRIYTTVRGGPAAIISDRIEGHPAKDVGAELERNQLG